MGTNKKYSKNRKKQPRNARIIGGGITIIILAIIVFIATRPSAPPGIGEFIPPVRSDHIQTGQPVDSPSEPPTSGSHYASAMPAGFYSEDSPEYLDPAHDGYLIHSLEHGYVIFWYNCQLLDEQGCSQLLSQIQALMDEFNGYKLIAFPRPSLPVPLVMTSWGYLQKFNSFDAQLARQFITTNQPLAPEPDAP